MEGFLNLKWKRWQRVLVTRTIAIVPTFCVAFFSDINDVTKMNDYLNAVMALQLPFATIPTIAFSSSKAIMGDFANGWKNQVVSILLSIVVIGINIFFGVSLVKQAQLSAWWLSLVGKFFVLNIPKLSLQCLHFDSYLCHRIYCLHHISRHPHVCIPRKLSTSSIQFRSKVCPKRVFDWCGFNG